MKVLLILSIILSLYSLSFILFGNNFTILAQQDLETIKYRDLVIDLGNGVKTNAQLTIPAVGNGPFPGVFLIAGSGAEDMNETSGYIRIDNATGTKIYPPARPFFQIAEYLSDRGFVTLRYDKRGVGENMTILDSNVWRNVTFNDLKHDAEKALDVLIQQHEVDANRITVLGHSDGTVITPRVAIDNPIKVKNIILMGTTAQNLVRDILRFQVVDLPLEYATKVLDRNHPGLISIQQIAKDPLLSYYLESTFLHTNNTKTIIKNQVEKFGTSNHISIQKQIKPALIKYYENETALKYYENETALNLLKCNDIRGCPLWFKSEFNLIPNLSIIGNISKSIGVLILNGENDTQTPVQQAFILQQRLTDVNHPDHTLITCPNVGHVFYPSSQWQTGIGSIQQYVLVDIYSWLESHNGFTPLTTFSSSSYTSNTTKINK